MMILSSACQLSHADHPGPCRSARPSAVSYTTPWDTDLPEYERSACWGFPKETVSVLEGVVDAWRFDYASWLSFGNDVTSFQLGAAPSHGLRVATLVNGSLFVQEGPFDIRAGPVFMADNVKAFQLEGDRVAALVESAPRVATSKPGDPIVGELWVKEGELDAPWVLMARNVLDFQLEGDRIGIIGPPRIGSLAGEGQGAMGPYPADVRAPITRLMTIDGPLYPRWSVATTDKILDFQLEGDRIAVLRERPGRGERGDRRTLTNTRSRELLVKESVSDRKFTSVAVGDIQQYQLGGDRIGVLRAGELLIKTGSLFADWAFESSGVWEFQLAAERTGYVTVDGELWVDGALRGRGVVFFELKPGGNRYFYGVGDDGRLRYWSEEPGGSKSFFCLGGLPKQGTIWDVQLGSARVGVLVNGTLYVISPLKKSRPSDSVTRAWFESGASSWRWDDKGIDRWT